MYTVYLIDDEKWALYDVKHTCPFAECGFSVVGENTNALAALDAVTQLKPDVVFVDIRMPALMGIDLIHMIKQRLKETVFIIRQGCAAPGGL